MGDRVDLVQGTLELMILRILSLEPMHGWGIGERIRMFSDDVFQVNQGSLYPALQRMRTRGWITADWGTTERNRRARFYTLTPAGQRALAEARADWATARDAVQRVLTEQPEPGS